MHDYGDSALDINAGRLIFAWKGGNRVYGSIYRQVAMATRFDAHRRDRCSCFRLRQLEYRDEGDTGVELQPRQGHHGWAADLLGLGVGSRPERALELRADDAAGAHRAGLLAPVGLRLAEQADPGPGHRRADHRNRRVKEDG